jgi:transposase InsO family protein
VSGLDWDDLPERDYAGYLKRLAIVELLLEEGSSGEAKSRMREQFCHDNLISRRTLANWTARYLKEGPAALLFHRQRGNRSPRNLDAGLRARILDLVAEMPSRSVAKLRRLLRNEPQMAEKMAHVSDRTIYRFLAENGLGLKQRQSMDSLRASRAYHSFQAPHSLALVQGDARDGIWLDTPEGGRRKTYLFVWLDDYSRKILFGKYYLDEKLPCLEDSFKTMVLRWGVPDAVYLDNGNVYISRQFASVLAELRIKGIHHKPYQAHCKGKVEAIQKTIKADFQAEAARAAMHTLQELNTAFWAWAEMDYNRRLHSSTGQSPDERFLSGLQPQQRRVEDLTRFQAMFLWKQRRTITKWGKISLHANLYPVTCRPPTTVVEVRYDPFDLARLLIYEPGTFTLLETTTATKQVSIRAPHVPEESKATKREVSQHSVAYFTRLRQLYLQNLKDQQDVAFHKLQHPTQGDHHE